MHMARVTISQNTLDRVTVQRDSVLAVLGVGIYTTSSFANEGDQFQIASGPVVASNFLEWAFESTRLGLVAGVWQTDLGNWSWLLKIILNKVADVFVSTVTVFYISFIRGSVA